ncbi:MAG: hypothetical protein FWD54_01360 [Endomicrobia bacterium]|nr:hypothetical protein [Endomicrobiia bacterium]MCL2798922.1 hypothetical protein [Endomicrobiia bacterium]
MELALFWPNPSGCASFSVNFNFFTLYIALAMLVIKKLKFPKKSEQRKRVIYVDTP